MLEDCDRWGTAVALCLICILSAGCSGQPNYEHSAVVTASAYNSLPEQTAGDPAVGAWGDELKPGMKAVAVSRDLVDLGLTHEVKIKIEGLAGTYRVLDKMGARWTDRIDIYMGNDVDAAREWGTREVTISWNPADPQ